MDPYNLSSAELEGTCVTDPLVLEALSLTCLACPHFAQALSPAP